MTPGTAAGPRPLVLAAHGSGSPAARAVSVELARVVAARLPGVTCRVGYLGQRRPRLDDVLDDALDDAPAGTPGRPAPVVVPLLLTGGYHARTDLPELVAGSGATTVLTPGPAGSPEVLRALADRAAEVCPATADRGLVLAAAGSSSASARAEVQGVARSLARGTGATVAVGFLSGPGPTVAAAAVALHRRGRPPAAAVAYLLGPGEFHERLVAQARRLGLGPVGAPLGAHPRLVDFVLRRYRGASRTPVPATSEGLFPAGGARPHREGRGGRP